MQGYGGHTFAYDSAWDVYRCSRPGCDRPQQAVVDDDTGEYIPCEGVGADPQGGGLAEWTGDRTRETWPCGDCGHNHYVSQECADHWRRGVCPEEGLGCQDREG